MKTLLLGAAAAAMSLTAFAASAQTYRGGHNPNYSNSYSRSHDQRGYDQRGYDRHDNRGWNNNYRSYAYNRSYGHRDNYRYDRDDNSTGAALAGGLIGLMLGSALADHGNSYQQPYGYAPSYGYQQPYYGYGY